MITQLKQPSTKPLHDMIECSGLSGSMYRWPPHSPGHSGALTEARSEDEGTGTSAHEESGAQGHMTMSHSHMISLTGLEDPELERFLLWKN